MIKGIGTDIVELDRLKDKKRYFIEKILTTKELEIYDSYINENAKLQFLGGRFAAKEAYLKANHVGLGAISFQDIEILNKETGEPYMNNKQTNIQTHISISHEQHYAIAFVVIEQ